jgi:DNA mismatch repair protein MutH
VSSRGYGDGGEAPSLKGEGELLRRLRGLGGATAGELAEGLAMPPAAGRAKGWVGRVLERALGASGRDGVDFPELGVELKTLPVDGRGRVKESTFVASATLEAPSEARWDGSRAHAKLRRVLWVVVEAAPVPVGDRRIGHGWLWTPSVEEAELLAADYAEIMGRVALGEPVGGEAGDALQLRPKGRDARARARGTTADGGPAWVPRRAWYLRPWFTQRLLDGRGLRSGP